MLMRAFRYLPLMLMRRRYYAAAAADIFCRRLLMLILLLCASAPPHMPRSYAIRCRYAITPRAAAMLIIHIMLTPCYLRRCHTPLRHAMPRHNFIGYATPPPPQQHNTPICRHRHC